MIVEKTGRSVGSMIGDEMVLMSVDTGVFTSLKQVGLLVWNLLDSTGDLPTIKDMVVERYAVSRAVCDAEIDAFVAELEQAGLVALRR